MGEKVPFELDNAVFSSKITSKDHRTLLINGELVADIIKNRREQWNLERKMKEAMERAQRVSSGMRM
jgi:plasmid recombination enzyme